MVALIGLHALKKLMVNYSIMLRGEGFYLTLKKQPLLGTISDILAAQEVRKLSAIPGIDPGRLDLRPTRTTPLFFS
jgi:hypothetical protein